MTTSNDHKACLIHYCMMMRHAVRTNSINMILTRFGCLALSLFFLASVSSLGITALGSNDANEPYIRRDLLVSTRPTTSRPTRRPTNRPTTRTPTNRPTTQIPTSKPTSIPSANPTSMPTSDKPTSKPTASPSFTPTTSPTAVPTKSPTAVPTTYPTAAPSNFPVTAAPSTADVSVIGVISVPIIPRTSAHVTVQMPPSMPNQLITMSQVSSVNEDEVPVTRSYDGLPLETLNPLLLPQVADLEAEVARLKALVKILEATLATCPTSRPTTSRPTRRPTKKPTTSRPTTKPMTSTPTKKPVAFPTKTTSPTKKPTTSPTKKPTRKTSAPRSEGGITWYVRNDGGSPLQCDGRTNAPMDNTSGRACAWAHPFHALPPGGLPRMAGGDRLVIGDGEYMMGYGAPGATNCAPEYPWDCHMPPIPSGPDQTRPTQVFGAGHVGCVTRPQLWGTERALMVLNLAGSSNVEVACLEITDHSDCVDFHSGTIRCKRDSHPFGPWAANGLIASDSHNVRLVDLDIHGLASGGVRAGRIADWNVVNVRIAANGWVGWDGDIDIEGAGSSNSGTLRFSRWVVEWNGCGETWPARQPTGCWGQTAGGYGDGVGTATTGGHWIIEDSVFRHNTSDGLDLLYLTGGQLTLDRVHAEGNAGNQIKARGPTTIRNAVVAGHCSFFRGKPFTHNVDDCRAMGDAVALVVDPGQIATLTSSTIYGEGNCMLIAEGDVSSRMFVHNSIFAGGPFALQPSIKSCWYYSEGGIVLQSDYLLIDSPRGPACPGSTSRCGVDPMLQNKSSGAFDPRLRAGSPARDTGAPVSDLVPAVDVYGAPRPAGTGTDLGAVEMQAR